jgi:hypothetical protein
VPFCAIGGIVHALAQNAKGRDTTMLVMPA